ncbi:LLM class flavin-dependent oxidoreductase [uncultured Draconibacterium sp.]|uniref:LLM class flavin-dependent oxidoreductase n=1 Tax=uncultured Draconibacterium sp. TaxID=1573823 RepID=UPI0029C6655D|nr:LLM class flavin-dependent oxidoreductase [uncultured Draconibacterium sp.]
MTDRKQLAFSVLDLAPVAEGSTPADALHNSLELAQHAEQLGYSRYWVAEHHNIISVASAATSIIIGYIAAGTKNIRVGSGGIMLPNHSPLIVSEQFGTLAAIYPNRIDLGLGRAPGTDPVTASELRYDRMRAAQDFPNEVRKIQQYFSPENRTAEVRSVLSEGANVPIFILGSSTDSAYLAAELGLPYAFASHFAPQMLISALKIYRENFKPSVQLDKPYVIIGSQVVAAETDDEAEYLASTMRRSFMGIITGRRELMQPPTHHLGYEKWGIIKERIDQMLACSLIGGREKIERELQQLIANTDADEIIVSSHIYDQQKRVDSYRIFSEVAKGFEY